MPRPCRGADLRAALRCISSRAWRLLLAKRAIGFPFGFRRSSRPCGSAGSWGGAGRARQRVGQACLKRERCRCAGALSGGLGGRRTLHLACGRCVAVAQIGVQSRRVAKQVRKHIEILSGGRDCGGPCPPRVGCQAATATSTCVPLVSMSKTAERAMDCWTTFSSCSAEALPLIFTVARMAW